MHEDIYFYMESFSYHRQDIHIIHNKLIETNTDVITSDLSID